MISSAVAASTAGPSRRRCSDLQPLRPSSRRAFSQRRFHASTTPAGVVTIPASPRASSTASSSGPTIAARLGSGETPLTRWSFPRLGISTGLSALIAIIVSRTAPGPRTSHKARSSPRASSVVGRMSISNHTVFPEGRISIPHSLASSFTNMIPRPRVGLLVGMQQARWVRARVVDLHPDEIGMAHQAQRHRRADVAHDVAHQLVGQQLGHVTKAVQPPRLPAPPAETPAPN